MDKKTSWAFFLNALNPIYIWRQTKGALAFCKTPTADTVQPQPLYPAIVSAIALLIGLKFLQVLIITVRVFAEEYNVMPALENAMASETDQWPWWQLLLAAGIVGPILEEVAFRAHLRFTRVLFALSAAVAAYYILTQGVYGVRTHDLTTALPVRMLVPLCVGVGFFAILAGLPRLEAMLASFWKNQFKWLFWGVALAFGLAHLGRYDMAMAHIPFIPLIILPQVLSAMVYGYVRMRSGLVYSIGLHIFANGVATSLASAFG